MYNIEVKEPGQSAFVGGINDDVSLFSIELVDVETSRYQGQAIDVTFEKNGTFLTSRRFPFNPENVRPRMLRSKAGQESREETQEEAEKRALVEYLIWFKSLLNVNFCDEEQWSSAMASAKDFPSFYAALVNLLPADYQEKKGQLICGYNNNNYLEVPREHWITRAFFSVEGKKPLVVSERVRTAPVVVASAPQPSNSTEEVDETDLWV
jgi:hypothetical protein